MTNGEKNVANWVQLFKDAGMTEEMMDRWHTLFEERHSEWHRDFLAWLGLSDQRVEEIRTRFRS